MLQNISGIKEASRELIRQQLFFLAPHNTSKNLSSTSPLHRVLNVQQSPPAWSDSIHPLPLQFVGPENTFTLRPSQAPRVPQMGDIGKLAGTGWQDCSRARFITVPVPAKRWAKDSNLHWGLTRYLFSKEAATPLIADPPFCGAYGTRTRDFLLDRQTH